jgi:hypothetical protein
MSVDLAIVLALLVAAVGVPFSAVVMVCVFLVPWLLLL